MAEKRALAASIMTGRCVSFAELGEWRLSGSVKSKPIGCCGSAAAGRGSQLCEADRSGRTLTVQYIGVVIRTPAHVKPTGGHCPGALFSRGKLHGGHFPQRNLFAKESVHRLGIELATGHAQDFRLGGVKG
jgi:hypothetical protein